MTMDLREEVAAALAESDWESLTPIHHAVFLQLADAALSVIQSRAKGQPGVDGLLPCPFCGSFAGHYTSPPRYYIACHVCNCQTGYSPTEKEAADAWNTRSTPSNPGGWQERPMPEHTVGNGKIVLPEGSPYDGKPVLIKLAVGWVEAWWDEGRATEDHEGTKDWEGWDWVCADDTFKADFDEPKAWMPLPESPPIPATEGEGS